MTRLILFQVAHRFYRPFVLYLWIHTINESQSNILKIMLINELELKKILILLLALHEVEMATLF